jgi:hypothetical protein
MFLSCTLYRVVRTHQIKTNCKLILKCLAIFWNFSSVSLYYCCLFTELLWAC